MGGRITKTGRAALPATGRTPRTGSGLTGVMVTARSVVTRPDLAAMAYQAGQQVPAVTSPSRVSGRPGMALRLTVPRSTAPGGMAPGGMAPRDTVLGETGPGDTGTLVRVRRRSAVPSRDSAVPGTTLPGMAVQGTAVPG